jgi:hypothetical protein
MIKNHVIEVVVPGQVQDIRSSEEHFSLFTSPFPAVIEKAAWARIVA